MNSIDNQLTFYLFQTCYCCNSIINHSLFKSHASNNKSIACLFHLMWRLVVSSYFSLIVTTQLSQCFISSMNLPSKVMLPAVSMPPYPTSLFRCKGNNLIYVLIEFYLINHVVAIIIKLSKCAPQPYCNCPDTFTTLHYTNLFH